MKKVILVLAICLGVSLTFTSCKKDKEEVKVEQVEKEIKSKEMASNTLYQCPMDCEKGKSYIKAGACPVCKMDLKAKEVDVDSEKKPGKDHDGSKEEEYSGEAKR